MDRNELVEYINEKKKQLDEAIKEKEMYEKSLYVLDVPSHYSLNSESNIARNAEIRLANTAEEIKSKISLFDIVEQIKNVVAETCKKLPIDEQVRLTECVIYFDAIGFKNNSNEVLDDIALVNNFIIFYNMQNKSDSFISTRRISLDSEGLEKKFTAIVKVSKFLEDMENIGYKVKCRDFNEFVSEEGNWISFSFDSEINKMNDEIDSLLREVNEDKYVLYLNR